MTAAQHHERAIAALADRARERGATGLVVVGSVARGTARPDSDVDAYEIVDDGCFRERLRSGGISWVDTDGCDWPGGYCDLKLASREWLAAAGAKGDDPVRASFLDARVVCDVTGDLPALIDAIVASPPERFAALADSFTAQLALHGDYFLAQALDQENKWLARTAAVHAATAAGRLALARAHVLYRGPKYLVEQLTGLNEAGARLGVAVTTLAGHPSKSALATVRDLLDAAAPLPPVIDDVLLSRFIIENELSWFTGALSAEAR